jgi:hypothetical protein
MKSCTQTFMLHARPLNREGKNIVISLLKSFNGRDADGHYALRTQHATDRTIGYVCHAHGEHATRHLQGGKEKSDKINMVLKKTYSRFRDLVLDESIQMGKKILSPTTEHHYTA